MVNNKNILFLFNQGSEIRQFIYSGVISKLLEEKYNIFISLRVNNNETKKLFNEKINIIDFYKTGTPFYFNLIKEVLNKIGEQVTSWKYVNSEVKFKSKINKIVYKALFYILYNLAKFSFIQKKLINFQNSFYKKITFSKWINLLQDNKIDEVIVTVPNTNFDLLLSSQKLKIPVKLIFHTNKDIFTLGKIYYPYEKVSVWNAKMKSDFLRFNNTFKEKQVDIVGCSHFSYLSSNQNKKNINIYKEFNIDSNKKIILYISAAPFVIQNEYENIKFIEKILKKLSIDNYKIIIKTNPMDDTNYWNNFINENIYIYNSRWRWDKQESFNYPHLDELNIFKKLLKISKCCIGLPSTVSIETAITNVANLNICFSYGNIKSIYSEISDMWFAPFYENTRKNEGAIPIFSEKDLLYYLKEIFLNKLDIKINQKKYLKSEITFETSELMEKTVNFIKGKK